MITGVSVGTIESKKLVPLGTGSIVSMDVGGFTPTPDSIADATGMLGTGTTTATSTGVVSTGVTLTSPSGVSGTVTTAVAVDEKTAEKIAAASDTKKSIATTVAEKASEVVKKDWAKPVALVLLLLVALFTGYKLFVGAKAVAA